MPISFNPPAVLDVSKVGEYPALSKAGGGHVWDEVLEYRVWCHPERGAPDEFEGSDQGFQGDKKSAFILKGLEILARVFPQTKANHINMLGAPP
jgi:hypothetical protein